MKYVDYDASVWYYRYHPQCVDDLVIPEEVRTQIKEYIENDSLPCIGLFSVIPGTGKSSTANAILKDLDAEALWINASLENGIDVVRGKITRFASQASLEGRRKVVVLDEFDNFTPDGMKSFRGFIDNYSKHCKFIFTGNYKEKIIEPLLDRLVVFDFNNFDRSEMIKPIFHRLCYILDNEEIDYDQKELVTVINTYYPRIRAMIAVLQRFTKNGKFTINSADLDDLSVFDNVMKVHSFNAFSELSSEVVGLTAPDNMYQFLFKNASLYFPPKNIPNVVQLIAKYQHMSSMARDKNINLLSCLTEMIPLRK